MLCYFIHAKSDVPREQLHVQRAERHGKVGACVPAAGDLGEGGPGLPAAEGQPARGGPARLWLPGGGGPARHPATAHQDGGRYPSGAWQDMQACNMI
jgi:hypothetical protein